MSFNKRIKIGQHLVHKEQEMPLIIAEMACAHDGDKAKALALIDAAAQADVDVIQLQIFRSAHNMTATSKHFDLIVGLEFSDTEWAEIYDYAHSKKLLISTFVYDLPSAILGRQLGSHMFKLNSSDLGNPDLLDFCAEHKIPTTLGTGASLFEEIATSVKYLKQQGGEDIILMHGVQNFPTDFNLAHIRKMAMLGQTFDCLVGYADHTEGGHDLSPVIDMVALGMGALVLEKHITLDRSKKGVDYQAALEPKELKTYVHAMRNAYRALGPAELIPLKENDFTYRTFQKKSITLTRDMQSGEQINREDIAFLRSSDGFGISPMKYKEVIGKQLSTNKSKFDHLHFSDLANS